MSAVKWQDNPLYRPKPRWDLRGRAFWLWRVLLAAVLAVFLIVGNYVGAAIFVALWIVAEILTLRGERRSAGAGESAGERGEDRQIGV